MTICTKQLKANTRQGFALIATLSIMVLMAMMALAMISLSTVELRSAQNDQAMAEARANARMAAMIALGRLQQLAGPDTRVTAPANIIDDEAYPLTGVWRSWEGLDHKNTGEPIIPPYDLKTANGSPTDETDSNRFLGWLVSGLPAEVFDVAETPDLSKGAGKITLVGEITTGTATDKDQVHVDPTFLSAVQSEGAIAWWISGQNQKAKIAHSEAPGNSTAEWNKRLKSHGAPNSEHFNLANDSALDKVSSNQSYDLVPEFEAPPIGDPADEDSKYFHDRTAWSRGLLTNTATGGWRRDLSLMTEQWDNLPSGEGELPFFTLKPGVFTEASKPDMTGVYETGSKLIFPWETNNVLNRPAVVTWQAMKDFATQYKEIEPGSGSKVIFKTRAYNLVDPAKAPGNRANCISSVRRYPTFARIQWVYSYSAKKKTDDTYVACIIANPVLTMWNPYNYEVTIPQLGASEGDVNYQTEEPSPMTFTFTVGGTPHPPVDFTDLAFLDSATDASLNAKTRVTLHLRGVHTFKPGETRVFSVKNPVPQDASLIQEKKKHKHIDLEEGLRTQGGLRYSRLHKNHTTKALTEIIGKADDEFSVTLKFDASFKPEDDNIGLFLNLDTLGVVRTAAYRIGIPKTVVGDGNYYPNIGPGEEDDHIAETTMGVAAGSNQPFGSAVFGFRTSANANIPTKGALQTTPLVFFTEFGKTEEIGPEDAAAVGNRHPANCPLDFDFMGHIGWLDNTLPEADPDSHRGYIISGRRSSTGLSRCVSAEIPTSPLQSLVELSHFDINNTNSIGPFVYNPIANSEATPLFPPDTIQLNHIQYDVSYVTNHLLFDDWFVSSIAPDTEAWSATEERNLETVYEDFIAGITPLPNSRYIPASSSTAPSPDDIEEALGEDDSYHTIASRLVVDGMFNVNSTSKKAWKAMLSHLTKTQIPILKESGDSWSIGLHPERDHPVSRFTFAADGTPGDDSDSGEFPAANDFAGHHNLTEVQIDALAEEIVRQVRLRGPFLSLSEFINRQLTTQNDELALAGTVQAALDALANLPEDESEKNPYKALQDESPLTMHSSDDPLHIAQAKSPDLEYGFPKAAEGYTAYGVPGWIRQADILRPLAPILSARDDTFLIRAYGDARDAQGNITARAWCELAVQRKAEYIDETDDPTDHPALKADSQYLQSEANERFGRRFDIMSFRWLSADEI